VRALPHMSENNEEGVVVDEKQPIIPSPRTAPTLPSVRFNHQNGNRYNNHHHRNNRGNNNNNNGFGSSLSFGWGWKSKQSQQQKFAANSAVTLVDTSGVVVAATRRFYVCNATTGRRYSEKQEIVVENPHPTVTRLRIVSLSEGVIVITDSGGGSPSQCPSQYVMAAGVLFYAVTAQGERLFLIGKEQAFHGWQDSEKWADFGGGVDVADEDIASTAARESYEETMGSIQNKEVLLNRLHNGESAAVFDIQTPQSSSSYRMFLLRIPYHDYNMIVNRFRYYLRSHKIQFLDAEKTALEWVNSEALISENSQFIFRETFSAAIREIAQTIELQSLP
jgi:8-oxo-dGTP pyrophosphatase MutT (NUDIX family)